MHQQEDNYLAVATLSDILFKPLHKYGKRVLAVVKSLILQHRTEFDRKYGIPNEVAERDDKMYLSGLDPVEWKTQDHYAVLGLKHLRFRATDEDIKKAYRTRCLKHHPDKRIGAGKIINPNGDYFACIVTAQEILGPDKRRSYDSVDPEFDNYVPSVKIQNDSEFYKVYGTWFALNARWSNSVPVPLLGNEFARRKDVDKFYQFWFDFDSWREYSYLDQEAKEMGQTREERKWIDRENKAIRAKLKKEESARIRGVVDAAYAYDPRIVKFKEADKQRKIDIKTAKRNLLQQQQMEADKIRLEAEESARLAREKEEKEAKEQELAMKKEKEIQKKLLKKERKLFRSICKDHKYFSNDRPEELQHLTYVDQLCEMLSLLEIREVNTKFSNVSVADAKHLFLEEVAKFNAKIMREKEESTKQTQSQSKKNGIVGQNILSSDDWTPEDQNLLVKAVNLFPPGTNSRWEVIANFLHQHAPTSSKRTAKQVLAKIKDLKGSDFSTNSMKNLANEKAFDVFEKTLKTVPVESEASLRMDQAAASTASNVSNSSSAPAESSGTKPWTLEEQKLLEQGLKTYTNKEPDRWDRIAGCIPGRSKRECMGRFKELAALIKAKKAALEAVAK